MIHNIMNQLKRRPGAHYHAGMKWTVCAAALFLLGASPAPSPGDLAFAHGDFDAALRAYSAAVASSPNAGSLLGLGTMELYRDDLRNSREHLTEAARLDPANPTIEARLRTLHGREPSATDFEIAMPAGGVRIPFASIDPLPLIRGEINGREAWFVLDTGASGVDLSAAGARRLGIATHAAGRGVFAGGKQADLQAGRIDTFAAGGLTVHGIPTTVVEGLSLKLGGHDIDGAIGTVFLRHFLSTIDYRHGALVLRERTGGSAAARAPAGASAASVPMWLVGDHFLFARGRVGDVEGLFNVDTGGTDVGVQLTKASLAAAGITPQAAKGDFVGGGGAVAMQTFTAPSVSLGTFTRRNVPGVFFPDGDQFGIFPFAVTGVVSHEFFRGSEVTLDFDTMTLTVS
jgi:predicted aspartyl protease